MGLFWGHNEDDVIGVDSIGSEEKEGDIGFLVCRYSGVLGDDSALMGFADDACNDAGIVDMVGREVEPSVLLALKLELLDEGVHGETNQEGVILLGLGGKRLRGPCVTLITQNCVTCWSVGAWVSSSRTWKTMSMV